MQLKILPLLVFPFILSGCTLPLSSERAATITSLPEPSVVVPTLSNIDKPDITDQELIEELNMLDDLDLDSDLDDLEENL